MLKESKRAKKYQIILTESSRLGVKGDIVQVKAGYARNYLIPFSKAIAWNKDKLSEMESIITRLKGDLNQHIHSIEKLKNAIPEEIVILRQLMSINELYEPVSISEIAEKLNKQIKPFFISEAHLHLEPKMTSIKTAGTYRCVVTIEGTDTHTFTVRVKE